MTSRKLTWPSFLLLLLAAWQLPTLVPAQASTAEQDSYIIVLTPGTGPEYVKAMCSEAASPWGRFSGACQHEFVQGLVGFSGWASLPGIASDRLGMHLAPLRLDSTL